MLVSELFNDELENGTIGSDDGDGDDDDKAGHKTGDASEGNNDEDEDDDNGNNNDDDDDDDDDDDKVDNDAESNMEDGNVAMGGNVSLDIKGNTAITVVSGGKAFFVSSSFFSSLTM